MKWNMLDRYKDPHFVILPALCNIVQERNAKEKEYWVTTVFFFLFNKTGPCLHFQFVTASVDWHISAGCWSGTQNLSVCPAGEHVQFFGNVFHLFLSSLSRFPYVIRITWNCRAWGDNVHIFPVPVFSLKRFAGIAYHLHLTSTWKRAVNFASRCCKLSRLYIKHAVHGLDKYQCTIALIYVSSNDSMRSFYIYIKLPSCILCSDNFIIKKIIFQWTFTVKIIIIYSVMIIVTTIVLTKFKAYNFFGLIMIQTFSVVAKRSQAP